MRRRTEGGTAPLVGGSSLLTIFAVLCLTVFAALSLATATADARLSQKSADAVREYYAADTAAEEMLARLRAGETPEGVAVSGDAYAYAVPISETQELRVELTRTDKTWVVTRYQAVYTGDWTPDTGLGLWDGVFSE